MIQRLLAGFAQFFTPAQPAPGPRRLELTLLLAIVAVGTIVRFWGLGAVGLHGDEKTMALPVQHILEHGTPLFPSGMFYARAIGQLYLMAASVAAFGLTEWALRLPSALCGVLVVVLAFFAGRRFLAWQWNLAFTALVALLPDFIVDAQTARMYVFLVASVAGFLWALFAWERTDRWSFLILAALVLLIGIQFHTLTVFSALLLFYPGLLHGDLRKFIGGLVAFAIVVAGFFAIDSWIAAQYPPRAPVEGFEELLQGPKAGEAVPVLAWWLIALASAAAVALAAFVVRTVPKRAAIPAFVLITAGLVAEALFADHLAFLFLIAGTIVAYRTGALSPRRLGVLVVVCAVVALVQLTHILSTGVSLRHALGAITGRPSIWPYLRVSAFSMTAVVLIALTLARGLWDVAHRRPIPDHVLFTLLGVWLPLFMIGFFAWDIPPRYAEGQIFPILLGGFAGAQWLFGLLSHAVEPARMQKVAAVASAAACVAMVNPVDLARTVNAGYAIHPDHKGAAEYMRAQKLGPRDVVLAEDVLQQTYYLGHVDYWLIAKYVAAQFVRPTQDVPREIYVNAPVIGTGEELSALLDNPNRGTLYIIGSGEDQVDGRRHARGLGIQEVLESGRFKVVYNGRDGLTKIWEAPPPSAAARQ